MNVVMFGKGFGRPRQVNLSGRSAAAYAFLIAGFLSIVAFTGGYYYSAHTGSGVSFKEAATKFGGDTHRFKEPIIAIVRHPYQVVVEGFMAKEKMS